MMKILEKRGVVVDVANNGRDAIDCVEANRYDIIFMDISMPVMDGVEATKQLREIYDKNVLPIIALTAHSGQDKAGEYLSCGMNSVMNKPIDSTLLNHILGQWLASAPPIAVSPDALMIGSEPNALIDEAIAEKLITDIGASVYQEIATLFEAECRKSIEKINDEYNELDFDQLAKTAHAILSSARSLGLERLGQHLKSLELAAADANTGDINILISTLSKLSEDSLQALKEYSITLTN
jgi:two-component system sensor histidine kinase/response regulator